MGSALRSAEAWRADRLFSQGASAFHSPALERVTHAAAGSRALLPVRPTLGVALLASTLGSPPAVGPPSRPSPLISCHSRQDFFTPGREARRSEVKGWRAQTATCPSAAPPVTQPRGCRRTRAGGGGRRRVGSQNFGMNIREPRLGTRKAANQIPPPGEAAYPGAPPPRDRKRPSPSEARVPSDSFTPSSLTGLPFPPHPSKTCTAASELIAHKYLAKVLREKKKAPMGPK